MHILMAIGLVISYVFVYVVGLRQGTNDTFAKMYAYCAEREELKRCEQDSAGSPRPGV